MEIANRVAERQPREPVDASLLPPRNGVYRAHGLFAPGVYLMRNIGFVKKSVVISMFFVLAAAVPMGIFVQNFLATSTAMESRKRGMQYNQALFKVLAALHATRAAATRGGEGMAPALAALQAAQQAHGAALRLPAFASELESAGRALPFGDPAPQARAAFDRYTRQLLAAMMGVTRAAALTQDAQGETFYQLLAAYDYVPEMLVDIDALAAPGQQDGADGVPQHLAFLARKLKSNFGQVEAAQLPAETQAAIAAFEQALRPLLAGHDGDGRATQGGSPAPSAGLADAARQAFPAGVRLQQLLADELAQTQDRHVRTLFLEMAVAVGFMSVVLGIATYLFACFYRATLGGLRLVSRHLDEMAEGDLRKMPADPWGKDESAMVIKDLQKTYRSLHALINVVRQSAKLLMSTSSEISAISLDLSVRTDDAATSLRQQASAIGQMGVVVANNAQQADLAARIACENQQHASNGGQVISDVVGSMHEMNAHSAKIGEIVGVINGLAFQTNILALNAAVEAARAGEQGRGFAVVASEVRSLAQRSASAATEIKDLISVSVAQVSRGMHVAEGAGSAMSEITGNAEKIKTVLTDVATASNEQAAGVNQVSAAIQNLDETTQHNAVLVDETAAAANQLAQQASQLLEHIARFRVK